MVVKEEICHLKRNKSGIDSLYLNEKYADVTFVIGGERIHAHRNILAVQNEYFHSMLFGGLRESSEREITLDVPVKAFKLMLKFFYTNEMKLTFKDSKNVNSCDILIEILKMANEYRVTDLVECVAQALTKWISLDNGLTLLKYAELYELKELTATCYAFIDMNASDFLRHKTFLELPKDLLITLLERDSFYALESEIFTAVLAWQKQNSSTDLELLLPYVRFSLISTDFFFEAIKPHQLSTNDKIFEIITNNRNAAVPKNRCVIRTQHPLSHYGFVKPADSDEIFYAEKMVSDNDQGNKLPIDLGEICTFNYIRFVMGKTERLTDLNLDLYITCDYLNWELHSQFKNCRPTLQHLTFPTCSAKCIRIDFTCSKILPLHNFQIVNVKKWRLGNITNAAMGAELIKGQPVNDHNLLAVRPFDSPTQLDRMAYTLTSQGDIRGDGRLISIQFAREWHICKIRARFLSKPIDLDIRFHSVGEGTSKFRPSLNKSTLDANINPILVHTINLISDNIECTHFECLAIPYEGYKAEIKSEGVSDGESEGVSVFESEDDSEE